MSSPQHGAKLLDLSYELWASFAWKKNLLRCYLRTDGFDCNSRICGLGSLNCISRSSQGCRLSYINRSVFVCRNSWWEISEFLNIGSCRFMLIPLFGSFSYHFLGSITRCFPLEVGHVGNQILATYLSRSPTGSTGAYLALCSWPRSVFFCSSPSERVFSELFLDYSRSRD